MLRVLKALVAAVLSAYILASVLSTQAILANVQAMGLDVGMGVRLSATLHDLVSMAPMYLLLITVAFILGLPVAAGLVRVLPARRALLYTLAGFVAIVALHLLMKAALGISGVPATRTLPGLLGQGLAGAVGGYCFHLLSRRPQPLPAAA